MRRRRTTSENSIAREPSPAIRGRRAYDGDMPEAIAITQATPGDLAAVLATDDRPDRATEVSEAVVNGRCSVAHVDDVIVGFGVRGTFFGHDFLELLVVAAEHR